MLILLLCLAFVAVEIITLYHTRLSFAFNLLWLDLQSLWLPNLFTFSQLFKYIEVEDD